MSFHLSFILHITVTKLMLSWHCSATSQRVQIKALCSAPWEQEHCIPCCRINITKASWHTCTCRHMHAQSYIFQHLHFLWQITWMTEVWSWHSHSETTECSAEGRFEIGEKSFYRDNEFHDVQSLQIVSLRQSWWIVLFLGKEARRQLKPGPTRPCACLCVHVYHLNFQYLSGI